MPFLSVSSRNIPYSQKNKQYTSSWGVWLKWKLLPSREWNNLCKLSKNFLPRLSLSLSLSHTHTHIYTHTNAQLTNNNLTMLSRRRSIHILHRSIFSIRWAQQLIWQPSVDKKSVFLISHDCVWERGTEQKEICKVISKRHAHVVRFFTGAA